jgi:hypothetical protein
MVSVLGIVFSALSAVLPLLLLGISITRKCVLKYFPVNFYAAALLLGDAVRYFVLWKYGYSSQQYFYAFFGTDILLVIATYLVVFSFYELIFAHTSMQTTVRWAFAFFAILAGVVSYFMIGRNLGHFYSRLMVELSQNMYFAAVILTVLVWISVNYLHVEDSQLKLLIAGLGISMSLQAALYATQNLLPADILRSLPNVAIFRHSSALATDLKIGLWCLAVSGYRLAERKQALGRMFAAVPVKGV